MDNFDSYQTLRDLGATPRAIYQAGKDDGLNSIACLKMLRSVCKLSLEDAKRVTGSDRIFSQPQITTDGSIVSWDVSDPRGGNVIRKGRVLAHEDDGVKLLVLEDYDMATGDFVALPVPHETQIISARYFQKSLVERLEEASQFWDALTRSV